VNTRRFGTFTSEHIYADKKHPSKSIVKFDGKKFKLPLRFIGSEQTSRAYPENDEPVKGKITLTYSYLNI